MAEPLLEQPSDRIILVFDPGQPMELTNLTDSFAALARIYERHHRMAGEQAPKLYITRLESGSIIAEIAPYVTILGAAVLTMDTAIIVSDFTNRLWRGIKAFSSPTTPPLTAGDVPTREDAHDLREFVRPLTGKPRARLGITHARFESHTAEKTTVVEYAFDEAELNRAAINIDEALGSSGTVFAGELEAPSIGTIKSEVMLFFEQASRKPGRERGRTGDRVIVPEVTDKALPVHFRKSIENLKDQMVRGDVNPLTNAFVVDVQVQYVAGEPKGYIVTNVHSVVPMADDE